MWQLFLYMALYDKVIVDKCVNRHGFIFKNLWNLKFERYIIFGISKYYSSLDFFHVFKMI